MNVEKHAPFTKSPLDAYRGSGPRTNEHREKLKKDMQILEQIVHIYLKPEKDEVISKCQTSE